MSADLRPWIAAEVGRDGWCHYLALDGEKAVATGALFVYGEVGALLGATTLKSHRGQGAQSALLAERIKAARDLGCEWLVTETWEEQAHHNPSYHNLLRAGFHEAYLRPNFMKRE
jgi:GNAT superfamily N-acetyltransferase